MDTIPPEKHLGFLINDVARLLRRAFDQAAQSCALTRAQWQVLAFLYHNEGSNQAAVAEALDVEPITLSRHIDRLEALGYVVRLPDPSDRRARRLQLTPAVRPHLQDMKAIGGEVLKSALEGLSEAETSNLIDALTLMRANMARYSAEPPAGSLPGSTPADTRTSKNTSATL